MKTKTKKKKKKKMFSGIDKLKASQIGNSKHDGIYLHNTTRDEELRLLKILFNPDSSKNERLFLVYRLKSFGYASSEVEESIERLNSWKGYNRNITHRWISFVFKSQRDFCDAPSASSLHPEKTGANIIKEFFTKCKPWHPDPPSGIREAALYYHSVGAHPIPMKRAEKLPLIRWKEYQNVQPSKGMIEKLDWSNGIILLGTHYHSFLDIDLKSKDHPDGLETFDDSILRGWTYERSKNGGYHVFGLGFFPAGHRSKGKGVEIKRHGGYIVTYPTPGYKIMRG